MTATAAPQFAAACQGLEAALALPGIADAAPAGRGEDPLSLQALHQALRSAHDAIRMLADARVQATQGLEDASAALADDLDRWRDAIDGAATSVAERVSQFTDDDLPALSDGFGEGVKQLDEGLQAQFGGALGELTANFGDELTSRQEATSRQVVEHAGALATEVSERLDQLAAFVGETFEDRIREAAAGALEDVAARLGEEIVENVALTQASVALTGTLSPLLPQLVALKVVVGAIKAALKLLRGGF